MSTHARTPAIGEVFFLTQGEGRIFFRFVDDEEVDAVLDTGWEFEFSEPLAHKKQGRPAQVTENRARLIADGEYAVFAFSGGTHIRLVDVVPTETLRLTLTNKSFAN